MKKTTIRAMGRRTLALLSTLLLLLPLIAATTVSATEQTVDRVKVVVSLGDSYSAGEGIEPFYGQELELSQKVLNHDWLAHRSMASWPGRLELPSLPDSLANYRDQNWYFTAVSGATTEHLNKSQPKNYSKKTDSGTLLEGKVALKPQLDIFKQVPAGETDYVTMTLGGNDAGFSDIIMTASKSFFSPNKLSDQLNSIDADAICKKLKQAYLDIEKAAGKQANIIVAGYPKLLDTSGSGFLFSADEAKLINDKVVEFNAKIKNVVNSCAKKGMKIHFVSVEKAFEGHGAYAADPYINSVMLSQQEQDLKMDGLGSAYSIHPNSKGAAAYAACVQNKINELEDVPIVVSMGDSYSSGEGIEPFYDQDLPLAEKQHSQDWLSHRSEHSWPGRLTVPGISGNLSSNRGTNWYFTAVSGATTTDLKNPQKKDYHQVAFGGGGFKTFYVDPQLDIFDQIGKNKTDFITITMGGNDAGFSDIIAAATATGSYFFPNALANKLKSIDVNALIKKLKKSYQDIYKAAGPQAQIIVAGYPRLINETGGGPFNADEAKLINEKVSEFNDRIEKLVLECKSNGMKIYFVSAEEAFEGHGAYSSYPYINPIMVHQSEDLSDLTPFSSYSIHPNHQGAGAYASCVQSKLDELTIGMGEQAVQTSDERDIVLVLDNSGSMSGTPIAETQKASMQFIDTVLTQDASIGVVGFSDDARMLSNFSMDSTQLKSATNGLYASGGTNILAGLQMANNMLTQSNAKKQIVILMSDGEPSNTHEELIAYAKQMRERGIIVYTLGFFTDLSDKSRPQKLMEAMATEGCHFEVSDTSSLIFFFGDVADQISGQKYIYVRIACPVDVTVTYGGETLSSAQIGQNTRTSFGSLTFEENRAHSSGSDGTGGVGAVDNRIKILRLKEGTKYDVRIEGTAEGRMNYTIGFMDKNGKYTDMRRFYNVKISDGTVIDTVAAKSGSTQLSVDRDGDGKYDVKYSAGENSRAEVKKADFTWLILTAFALLVIAVCLPILRRKLSRSGKE